MPERYLSAVATVKTLALSMSGTVVAAASLGEQLNATHVYLNLHLPYWFFLASMVVLNFIGAFFSLKTDYMRANGTAVGNFLTASLVGLVLSFVVIPTVTPTSGVGLMQIASLISGLCGTILLRVIINILNRKDLQEAIVDLVVQKTVKLFDKATDIFTEHAMKILTSLFIGFAISAVYSVNSSDKTDSPVPVAQRAEVSSD